MTKRTAAEQAAYDKKLAYWHENMAQSICDNLNANVLKEHIEDLANKEEQDRIALKRAKKLAAKEYIEPTPKKSAIKGYIKQVSSYFGWLVYLIFISTLLVILITQ